jgi:hypothetical protein
MEETKEKKCPITERWLTILEKERREKIVREGDCVILEKSGTKFICRPDLPWGNFYGDCPACWEIYGVLRNDGLRYDGTGHNSDNFFVCDRHGVRWYFGSGFYPELYEAEEKPVSSGKIIPLRRRLETYRVVEAVFDFRQTAEYADAEKERIETMSKSPEQKQYASNLGEIAGKIRETAVHSLEGANIDWEKIALAELTETQWQLVRDAFNCLKEDEALYRHIADTLVHAAVASAMSVKVLSLMPLRVQHGCLETWLDLAGRRAGVSIYGTEKWPVIRTTSASLKKSNRDPV